MERHKYDYQWVVSLLGEGETSRVECKLAVKAIPDSFWESYSAFANTDGGIVLLGIREEKREFTIEGVSDAKKLVSDFWNTVNGSKVSANVVYDHNVRVIDCKGKTVIAIEIPRADRSDRPVHVGEDVFKGTFRRNGEGDGDATWSGNVLDFFFKVNQRITADVKTPCRIASDNVTHDDDTPVHKALREVLANALIHADYHGRQGIVVEKRYKKLSVSNPGALRISKSVAIAGGTSDARNAKIFNIFSLVKIGERSGIGLSNLFGVWEQSGYARPTITESFDPERTRVDVEIEVSEKSTEKRGEYTGKSTERNVALTETEEKIVAILMSNGYATQKSISAKLGITRTYVTKIMGELQSKGVICRVGPDKGGHWEVVKKGRMS